MAVVVQGAEQFHALATRLKTADKPIRLAVRRGLRTIARPLGVQMRNSGAAAMPGELAGIVRGTGVSIALLGGRSATVQIRLKLRAHDVEAMNRGQLRHPTFGHSPWVSQSVQAGTFMRPFLMAGPMVRAELNREIARALDDIAN